MSAGPDQTDLQEREHAVRELERAQNLAQQKAASHDAPMQELRNMDAGELWDKMTNPDVESEEYAEVVDLLKPYLSSSQMLTSRDSSTYSDWARGLLNQNLADRVIKGREYGEMCTGPFLEIAQREDGDPFDGIRKPWSQQQKEGIRHTIENVKTDREALGDGTFLEKIADIHVSTETVREGNETETKGGLRSLIPGF